MELGSIWHFNVFEVDGQECLTTGFLLNQSEVEERSERRVRPPWSGYYFVNAGLEDHRSWDDMKRFQLIFSTGYSSRQMLNAKPINGSSQ